jgi:hypothetical protein
MLIESLARWHYHHALHSLGFPRMAQLAILAIATTTITRISNMGRFVNVAVFGNQLKTTRSRLH